MLEVEMKFRTQNWNAIREILDRHGATATEPHQEVDHYFNAPDRNFAETDEALRIRRYQNQNCITYKGPKRELATKTRTEIELSISPGNEGFEKASLLFQHLGYRSVGIVRKTRQIWHLDRNGFSLEVCFDDVESVGQFVEIEIQAEESQFEMAKDTLLALATELGLTEQERRSYLHFVLLKK